MTLNELIEQLQGISNEHGRDKVILVDENNIPYKFDDSFGEDESSIGFIMNGGEIQFDIVETK